MSKRPVDAVGNSKPDPDPYGGVGASLGKSAHSGYQGPFAQKAMKMSSSTKNGTEKNARATGY